MSAFAKPLRIEQLTNEKVQPEYNFGWCLIDANNRVVAPYLNERQANELLAALSVPPEALRSEWLPIDTAPKDGTNVLLVNRKGNIAAGLWQGSGPSEGWWLRGGAQPNVFFNNHHGPTHWMPLPAAPSVPSPLARRGDEP